MECIFKCLDGMHGQMSEAGKQCQMSETGKHCQMSEAGKHCIMQMSENGKFGWQISEAGKHSQISEADKFFSRYLTLISIVGRRLCLVSIVGGVLRLITAVDRSLGFSYHIHNHLHHSKLMLTFFTFLSLF